jgi:hypothetical protein
MIYLTCGESYIQKLTDILLNAVTRIQESITFQAVRCFHSVIMITKLKTEDINRGLDIWIMNRETIKI